MRPHDTRKRPARSCLRPIFEPLEARDLPSSISMKAAHSGTSKHVAATIHTAATSGPYNTSTSGLIGKGKLQPFLDPAVVQQAAELLYGPAPTATSPNPFFPTPQEIQRQEFTASASGRYTIGPPGFSDRSERITFYGKNATSDAFLKGKWQAVLNPPANPNATPTPGDPYANQTVGVAVLIPQAFLQTGSGLILDLNAAATPNALPTHGTWTFDVSSSGGFAAPLNFTQGTGTWDAVYMPDPQTLPGTSGSGQVVFRFQGLYNFSALLSGTSKAYS